MRIKRMLNFLRVVFRPSDQCGRAGTWDGKEGGGPDDRLAARAFLREPVGMLPRDGDPCRRTHPGFGVPPHPRGGPGGSKNRGKYFKAFSTSLTCSGGAGGREPPLGGVNNLKKKPGPGEERNSMADGLTSTEE